MTYLYLKALHIIFIVTWFAGLFYIVRLFIYYKEAEEKEGSAQVILQDQFRIMIQRLWLIITWPSAICATLFGLSLLHLNPGLIQMEWMWIKLGFVSILFFYHFKCHLFYKQTQNKTLTTSSYHLRLWNEVATLVLVPVVFIVTLKNSLSWLWGTIGFFAFVMTLFIAIRGYKKFREGSKKPVSK